MFIYILYLTSHFRMPQRMVLFPGRMLQIFWRKESMGWCQSSLHVGTGMWDISSINWYLIPICDKADLVSLHSEEEDRFVRGLKSGARIWLNGRKTGGQWQWEDGTPWDYQNWSPGQPSGDGNCLDTTAEWNDRGCTNIGHDMHFVCRKHSGS